MPVAFPFLAGLFVLSLLAGVAAADEGEGKAKLRQGGDRDYVTGRPAAPSEAWILSFGGRLYDDWMKTLDKKAPAGTHPAYPKSAKQTGALTWRCKECHGWDYKGAGGQYASGSHATGIKGIDGAAGRDPERIAGILRSRIHGYGTLLPDQAIEALALFVSKGQHDADQVIDPKTGNVKGDAKRGAAIFQTVCAACHGFDGKTLDWGTAQKPAYVGTEANANAWEVLHKLENAHPGAAMVSLRAFSLQDAVDALAYARTLPVK
ncbi:MAG: c-type cytochrome [Rhodospirillales bacterium]